MTSAGFAEPLTFAKRWHRRWSYVLDVGLAAWVLRAPLLGLVAGTVILWLTPQAQDLFVDLATDGPASWLRFFAVLILVWAAPTEYAAHILITTDERWRHPVGAERDRCRAWLSHWAPKILGALVFVCILGAVVRSGDNVPSLPDAHYVAFVKMRLTLFTACLIGLLVAFWCYVLFRSAIARNRAVLLAEAAAAVVLRPLRRWLPPIFALHRSARGHSEIHSDLAPLLLIAMFVLFAALPTLFPFAFATAFPRAAAVPFVIGGWIPLLSILAGLGRRLRAPLILLLVGVRTFLPLAIAPDYRVEAIDPAATVAELTGREIAAAGALDPIALNDAVAWWKAANHCDRAGQTCPRPIIVAAAGGGSRAGFFSASVIGQLLDDQLRFGDGARGHGLSPSELTDRLFAFSAVSGSAVAAVDTVAALAASQDDRPPCQRDSAEDWKAHDFGTWRGCLENLLAGDFLSPIFTGLVFRDSMRFLRLRGRAWLLERSWRHQFRTLIDAPVRAADGLVCVGSLHCPFLTLRPTPARWLPLLLLNGTSVATGQRIITTPLGGTYRPAAPCSTGQHRPRCNLFVQAYRFHDLLNGPPARDHSQGAPARDVDLATAALNSARFPLISPPGEIRDADQEIVDRVVDGGYFENFGVQTATELAQAIEAVDSRLDPFILVLANNPEVPGQGEKAGQARAGTQRSRSGALMTDLSAPIAAFAHTRDARGTLAIEEARALLDRTHPDTRHIAEIRVWGEELGPRQARAISMSWWLSKPLQMELHEQTDFDTPSARLNPYDNNAAAIGALQDALLGGVKLPAPRPAGDGAVGAPLPDARNAARLDP